MTFNEKFAHPRALLHYKHIQREKEGEIYKLLNIVIVNSQWCINQYKYNKLYWICNLIWKWFHRKHCKWSATHWIVKLFINIKRVYKKKKKYSTKINYNRISYPINIMENCNDVKLKDDRKRDVSTTRRPLIHTLNITLLKKIKKKKEEEWSKIYGNVHKRYT